MPPKVALFACVCFIIILFIMDRRWRPDISIGGWVPLIWVLIIGSRPVSSWFSGSVPAVGVEDGSPIDRLFYQLMIFAGLFVLISRKINWSQFFTANKWLVLYFAYFGFSVFWSDYTFVAFKRWIKEIGHIVMILIILSEKDPAQAIKSLLLRCSYVLIPLSVVFVKYFSDLGRYYDPWTGHAYYCGVTTNKNLLGMTLAALGITLLWALIDLFDEPTNRGKKLQYLLYTLLLTMTVWLFTIADSATAITCAIVGVVVIIMMRYNFFRKHVRALVGFGVIAVVFGNLLGVGDIITSFLGRDSSLTGRTDIWEAVLNENTNPLIGTGFYSFWMGDRVHRLSEKYHYLLNEAHNGYLELYLNGGFIGLALLLMVMWSAVRRLLAKLSHGDNKNGLISFRLAILVATINYNLTEAIFSRMNIIWFFFLLIVCLYPQPKRDVTVHPASIGSNNKMGLPSNRKLVITRTVRFSES